LFSCGTITVTNSTLSANTVGGGSGGNGGNGSDDVIPSPYGGNAGTGGAGQGGALFSSGTITVTNSTLSTNTVGGGNGGNGGNGGHYYIYYGRGGNGGNGAAAIGGGGIYVSAGTSELTNSTVAFNTAQASLGGAGGMGSPPGSPGTGGPGQGGGVSNAGGAVNALNTLVGDNSAGSAPDFSGNFASASHNFLADGTGSNLVNGVNGNLVGSHDLPINPRLGPLTNNGGPTFTHALLAGSSAIDAGDNADAPMWDQRGPGFPRIIHGIIDIGAFEYRAPRQLDPNPVPISEPGPSPDMMQPGLPDSQPTLDLAVEALATAAPPRTQTAFSPVPLALHEFVRDSLFDGSGDPLLDGLAGTKK
jgi:hypothetical protein